MTRATRLGMSTARRAMRRMSTSGWVRLVSTRPQIASRIAAAAKSPRTRADPQPQVLARLTPTRSEASARAISPAPAQSIGDGSRTGDSGT